MRLHVKNLQLLSKPLSEIEAQIPQVSSLDQSVLHSLTSIKEIISKVGSVQIFTHMQTHSYYVVKFLEIRYIRL